MSKDSTEIEEKQKASKILLRPNISMSDMVASIERIKPILREFTGEELEQAEIQIKYERYIEKEKDLVTRMSAVEELIIPDTFDYDKVSALSNEALQKFKRIKPRTLGQASRISGVNP